VARFGRWTNSVDEYGRCLLRQPSVMSIQMRFPLRVQVVMERVDKPRTVDFKGATDLVTE
jgi:hypothetical protein